MVDGDTYVCVKSFCYQADILDGTDIAATDIIGNGCMKFIEILPFLTSRVPPSLDIKIQVYNDNNKNNIYLKSNIQCI